ncbi:ABC transporter substrate-binding protein [Actinomyces sp. B33]|uniref:ABC transporter substrate-binding protein n=1 Tax=Actinomyces sp. B33 TaxID=2942131 RepID=UPI0023410758|nr:MqnA/MqnD/SBP family protein [Actinomyces sp. B33]MDC4232702.1 ABC transporter substrate-binding protein [Actinomyces sp. B33]
MIRRLLAASGALALGLGLAGCSTPADPGAVQSSPPAAPAETAPARIDSIRAYVPQTMAFGAPMAGFGAEGHLAEFSDDIEVTNWENIEQLKAALMGGQVEVAATPAYVAANLYNKGVDIQFVGPVVWGMLHVVGPADAPQGDWEQLRGARIAVPMPGNMPDLVFRYLLKQKGLTPDDLEIVPVDDSQQVLQMLVQGQVDWAVLPEHGATVAAAKAKEAGIDLASVIDLQTAWGEATGGEAKFPMAGLVMPGELARSNPGLVDAVRAELTATIDKLNAGDEQTLQKVADHYGLPLPIVTAVVPKLRLDMVPAGEARAAYEDFLTRIGSESSDIYGGTLPDSGFYGG